jgi:hypothetical protein
MFFAIAALSAAQKTRQPLWGQGIIPIRILRRLPAPPAAWRNYAPIAAHLSAGGFSPVGGGQGPHKVRPPVPTPSIRGKTKEVVSFVSCFCLRHIFFWFGGFVMNYQVCSTFKFSGSKAKLVNLSLHSTAEFQSPYNPSVYAVLNQSHFFHSVKEAQGYISYLYLRHPEYTAPRPVLDAMQLSLF